MQIQRNRSQLSRLQLQHILVSKRLQNQQARLRTLAQIAARQTQKQDHSAPLCETNRIQGQISLFRTRIDEVREQNKRLIFEVDQFRRQRKLVESGTKEVKQKIEEGKRELLQLRTRAEAREASVEEGRAKRLREVKACSKSRKKLISDIIYYEKDHRSQTVSEILNPRPDQPTFITHHTFSRQSSVLDEIRRRKEHIAALKHQLSLYRHLLDMTKSETLEEAVNKFKLKEQETANLYKSLYILDNQLEELNEALGAQEAQLAEEEVQQSKGRLVQLLDASAVQAPEMTSSNTDRHLLIFKVCAILCQKLNIQQNFQSDASPKQMQDTVRILEERANQLSRESITAKLTRSQSHSQQDIKVLLSKLGQQPKEEQKNKMLTYQQLRSVAQSKISRLFKRRDKT